MKKEIAQALVSNLKSGYYVQGSKSLKDGENRYCVMGVLCDMHSKMSGTRWNDRTYMGCEKYLPDEVRVWAKMKTCYGLVRTKDTNFILTSMNDRGTNFQALATFIEQNYEKL